ncbi:TetR/AcrR family transcriptional regulator [Clostridium sp. C8-1-8]|uniref:TetR/AcrR family transcriptional regulator n=1 Tax=Clostridium sp. C8-1-8 TaxID=2698831 RepID=UPI001FAB8205|nr:TetR/AcrR family transcriptional regulator [Clostridium sp. C8-1-8]
MKKTNPIAEQSKRWLVKALIELMQEKPYSSISVKEIADKAQLSRRTFYRNFNIKEDLLTEYANYLFKEYMDALKELTNLNISDLFIVYFKFWNNHLKELKLFKKNHLFYSLMEQINLFISHFNTIPNVKWHDYDNQAEEEYISFYNIGGLWNVLSNWIDHEDRESPEEMSKILTKAISNFSKGL